MKQILIWFISIIISGCSGYLYGKSQVKMQVVEKQVEVVKYVAEKRAKIQAKPNANRDELLKLMRAGSL